jgi:hypothetical protein
MTKPISFRDVEKLSALLDGQLPEQERRALEIRLESDPGLASAMEAMAQSRSLLRKLPQRRAPRNFTLSPKLVARKPPLPQAYVTVQWATALASTVFVFLLAAGALRPMAAAIQTSAAPRGMGGGAAEEAPAMEAATEAATEAPPEAPMMSSSAEEATEAAAMKAAETPTLASVTSVTEDQGEYLTWTKTATQLHDNSIITTATDTSAAVMPRLSATSTMYYSATTNWTALPTQEAGIPSEGRMLSLTPGSTELNNFQLTHTGTPRALYLTPTEVFFATSTGLLPPSAVPEPEAADPTGWLLGLGIAILTGLVAMFGMRLSAVRRWRRKAR